MPSINIFFDFLSKGRALYILTLNSHTGSCWQWVTMGLLQAWVSLGINQPTPHTSSFFLRFYCPPLLRLWKAFLGCWSVRDGYNFGCDLWVCWGWFLFAKNRLHCVVVVCFWRNCFWFPFWSVKTTAELPLKSRLSVWDLLVISGVLCLQFCCTFVMKYTILCVFWMIDS